LINRKDSNERVRQGKKSSDHQLSEARVRIFQLMANINVDYEQEIIKIKEFMEKQALSPEIVLDLEDIQKVIHH
jgi:hypothetical protein